MKTSDCLTISWDSDKHHTVCSLLVIREKDGDTEVLKALVGEEARLLYAKLVMPFRPSVTPKVVALVKKED